MFLRISQSAFGIAKARAAGGARDTRRVGPAATRAGAGLLTAGAALVLAAGCSSGPPTVTASSVEQQITTQLTAKVGQSPKSVTCPGSMQGTVGQSMTCTLTANDGSTVPVVVTVTSVSGINVHLHISVGTKVTPAPSSS